MKRSTHKKYDMDLPARMLARGKYEGWDYIPGGDEESASCGAGETPKTHCLHTMEITALLNLTAQERFLQKCSVHPGR